MSSNKQNNGRVHADLRRRRNLCHDVARMNHEEVGAFIEDPGHSSLTHARYETQRSILLVSRSRESRAFGLGAASRFPIPGDPVRSGLALLSIAYA